MDPRSERAIRLGAEIDTLRAKRVRLESDLEALRKLIMMREIEFEHVMRSEQANSTSPIPLAASTTDVDMAVKPVTEQVREHFRRHQDLSFSPAEVGRCLHTLESQDAAIRQALKRLTDSNYLIKTGQGAYQFNPENPERRKTWLTHEDR